MESSKQRLFLQTVFFQVVPDNPMLWVFFHMLYFPITSYIVRPNHRPAFFLRSLFRILCFLHLDDFLLKYRYWPPALPRHQNIFRSLACLYSSPIKLSLYLRYKYRYTRVRDNIVQRYILLQNGNVR